MCVAGNWRFQLCVQSGHDNIGKWRRSSTNNKPFQIISSSTHQSYPPPPTRETQFGLFSEKDINHIYYSGIILKKIKVSPK